MRRYGRDLLAIALGVAIGACGTFLGMREKLVRQFADSYVLDLADQANVAREIYAGRGARLADRIRQSLPNYVRVVEREFRRGRGRDLAYWLVRDVYDASHSAVPESIRPLLERLPPRAACASPRSRFSSDAF